MRNGFRIPFSTQGFVIVLFSLYGFSFFPTFPALFFTWGGEESLGGLVQEAVRGAIGAEVLCSNEGSSCSCKGKDTLHPRWSGWKVLCWMQSNPSWRELRWKESNLSNISRLFRSVKWGQLKFHDECFKDHLGISLKLIVHKSLGQKIRLLPGNLRERCPRRFFHFRELPSLGCEGGDWVQGNPGTPLTHPLEFSADSTLELHVD